MDKWGEPRNPASPALTVCQQSRFDDEATRREVRNSCGTRVDRKLRYAQFAVRGSGFELEVRVE